MSFVDQVLVQLYHENIKIEELRRTICEHGMNTFDCKTCEYGGFRKQKMQEIRQEQHKKENRYCIHKKTLLSCKECVHTRICEHYEYYTKCQMCHGVKMCEHKNATRYCKECYIPSSYKCKTPLCDIKVSSKYEGYCLRCFIYTFPDKQITYNYKTKEKEVVDKIMEKYGEFSWVVDKKIENGCSRRRPDLLLNMGSHVIIVEIDENKHSNYNCECEHKRLMEISQDLQHVPIVFIRFNPDAYIDIYGNNVKTCWKVNRFGIMVICDIKNWNMRISKLLDTIGYWMNNSTDKIVEIIELFY